jgi:thermolysin
MKHLIAATAVVALVLLSLEHGQAQQSSSLQIRATGVDDLRRWDSYVTARERAGELKALRVDHDPSIPSRSIERLQQYHEGVQVWGAQVVRDSSSGLTESIFGEVTPPLALSTTPALSRDDASARLLMGTTTLLVVPELVVLPITGSEPRLAYAAVVASRDGVFRVFVDANSGAELLRYSEIQTQSAVGSGVGVNGDTKKLSVRQQGGQFVASDALRPPSLVTYDMRGNFFRLDNLLDGLVPFVPSDVASDTDNVWTDVSAVDAHAHIGWTYDYYYKRHGRHGLDDHDRPIVTLINGVTPEGALTLPPDFFFQYAVNAFWCNACAPGRTGAIFFGNGMPAGFYLVDSGQSVVPLAGALDIAAHELTHAVTSSSSNLIYQNESGALNESFSDVMGASVEFFFQTPGPGRGQADYVLGEDAFRAFQPGSVNGTRSLENPRAFGYPDHYLLRYTGSEDGGGVHVNSSIPNHAFYLAIEGGTNRTSGLSVQGVGATNREQIEKVFYRAFVFLLPSNATFSTARAATIQAARDLYGATSAAATAVTQAWTAVGVN